jgi:hypothetical protein
MNAALAHTLATVPALALYREARRCLNSSILLSRSGRHSVEMQERGYRAYLLAMAAELDGDRLDELEGLYAQATAAGEAPGSAPGFAAADGVPVSEIGRIERYLLAGRPYKTRTGAYRPARSGAMATLYNARTGRHFSYQLRAVDGSDTRWFVDRRDEGGWSFLGTLRRDVYAPAGGGRYRFTVKHAHQAGLAFGWFVGCFLDANRDLGLEVPVQVWTSGACARCGRELTDPVSVAWGLGPVCRRR